MYGYIALTKAYILSGINVYHIGMYNDNTDIRNSYLVLHSNSCRKLFNKIVKTFNSKFDKVFGNCYCGNVKYMMDIIFIRYSDMHSMEELKSMHKSVPSAGNSSDLVRYPAVNYLQDIIYSSGIYSINNNIDNLGNILTELLVTYDKMIFLIGAFLQNHCRSILEMTNYDESDIDRINENIISISKDMTFDYIRLCPDSIEISVKYSREETGHNNHFTSSHITHNVDFCQNLYKFISQSNFGKYFSHDDSGIVSIRDYYL